MRARAPNVRPGSRTSPRLIWVTNQDGRYPSIGSPGLTASHHSTLGHVMARSRNEIRRKLPALPARQMSNACGDVNAST
jgi:hypothetical protein